MVVEKKDKIFNEREMEFYEFYIFYFEKEEFV